MVLSPISHFQIAKSVKDIDLDVIETIVIAFSLTMNGILNRGSEIAKE